MYYNYSLIILPGLTSHHCICTHTVPYVIVCRLIPVVFVPVHLYGPVVVLSKCVLHEAVDSGPENGKEGAIGFLKIELHLHYTIKRRERERVKKLELTPCRDLSYPSGARLT